MRRDEISTSLRLKNTWLRCSLKLIDTVARVGLTARATSLRWRDGTITEPVKGFSPRTLTSRVLTARRCRSVAARVRRSPSTWKSTPVNTGDASSALAAMAVWDTALAKSAASSSMAASASRLGSGGNSTASMPWRLVRCTPQLSLSTCVEGSSSMVHGASARDATYSLRRRAGTVVRPSVVTSAGTVTDMVRSRLVAVTRRPDSVVSSRTLPSTGSVDRGETARETSDSAALSVEGEREHFILRRTSRWTRLSPASLKSADRVFETVVVPSGVDSVDKSPNHSLRQGIDAEQAVRSEPRDQC